MSSQDNSPRGNFAVIQGDRTQTAPVSKEERTDLDTSAAVQELAELVRVSAGEAPGGTRSRLGVPRDDTIAMRMKLNSIIRLMHTHHKEFVQYISEPSRNALSPADIAPSTNGAPSADVAPSADDDSSEVSIGLGKLLKVGAKIAGILFISSLLSWAYADFPIVNPYLSILGLIACPFFYMMGKVAHTTTSEKDTT